MTEHNLSDDCANCLDYIYDSLLEYEAEEDGMMVISLGDVDTVFDNLKTIRPCDGRRTKESDVCIHSRVCRFRFVSDPDCKNTECSSFYKK